MNWLSQISHWNNSFSHASFVSFLEMIILCSFLIVWLCTMERCMLNTDFFIELQQTIIAIPIFKTHFQFYMHTGTFAQNSFQIDTINSCSTSKKLQFWLKIVRIIYFLTLKLIKGKLRFIFEIMKKMLGGATSQKSQKEM